MHIRKYIGIFLSLVVFIILVSIIGYQYFYSINNTANMEKYNNNFRFAKVNEDKIQIYKEEKWEDFQIKGIELSSFSPGYSRYKTSIDKENIMKWLEEIKDLNGNLIKIPNIQPPSFYNAIYDYNENTDNPIYIIHEVMLDEKAVLKYYDIYNRRIINNFKRDIKNTINVVHGRAVLFTSKRNHSGLYLKDISKYNLGYILGTNTNPEIVSLSDLKHSHINEYKGKYLSLEDSSPFEGFVGEMLDFAMDYEIKKYKQVSLFSYLTDVETDPLDYKQEGNQTKNAKINMEKMKSKAMENLFVAYRFHPNSADFLDYEYETSYESNFSKHLKRLNEFYEKPLLISDTGISSSRGISKVDKSDGFNRGGFTETEQGENIVKLLKSVDKSGSAGAIIRSWQDDWTSLTSLFSLIDYLDENASSYWHDTQSSDESFGLISFEEDIKEKNIHIDGDFEDWKREEYIIDEEIKLKVKSDFSYLYLFLEKKDWSLVNEELYVGIDITPKSGSDYWKKENVRFDLPVDFIIHLNGYKESRIVVNERYNIFNYLYKYYSKVIDTQNNMPEKDSNEFSPIYLLNRKNFYFSDTDKIIEPTYYETGKLIYGDSNPKSKDYNSLTDFNKNGDFLEIRIPWTMINVKNPIDIYVYDDFYKKGVEEELEINSIGFSIYDKDKDKTHSGDKEYKLEKQKNKKYKYRFKKSYYILKKYWSRDI